MVTLDQVEELRQRTGITYEEAKVALEATNGDVLEAIINLERENRIEVPIGGYYSSKEEGECIKNNIQGKDDSCKEKGNHTMFFKKFLRKFFIWTRDIINRGNKNNFIVRKKGENITIIPVTVLALLLIFMFWITVPLLIIGLFLDYRYMFSGPDLGKESVNRAMDSVAQAAENLKNEVKGD